MPRLSLFVLAVCVGTVGHARTPTPDNVDLKLVPRAGSPTLGAFEAGTAAPPPPPPPPPPPVENAIRINFAGPEYVDSAGDTWDACNTSAANPCAYVTWAPAGDGFYTNANPIAGTVDDTLYQTVGVSDAGNGVPLFNLDFTVTNGDYSVSLLFAEDWRTAADERVFHVDIEGVRQWSSLDPFAEAGINAALVKTVELTIADGAINIDLVPISGKLQPTLSAVAIVSTAAPPTGAENPYGLNDVLPATTHAIPVLMPGTNNQCRTGYTCITIPTTCDHTFDVADNEATVESELNNAANGYRYCAPLGVDWSTFTIDWTRDCSGETGGRCYLVPEDMDTRTQNPYLTASPTMGRFHVDNLAHSLVIAGWKIDNTADTHAGSMIYVDSGESADDIVIAHNECIGLGSPSSTGRVSCVEARGDDWIIHSNIAHTSEYKPSVDFDFVSAYGGDTTMVHRNSCWDMSGSCLYVTGANPNLFVVNNHYYQSTALLVANGGSQPFGTGAYLCGGALIDINGGGVETTSEGYIYGNILSGARKPEAACGSATTHIGYPISFGDSADAYNVYWNAVYNSHAGIGGINAGTGGDGSTISANIIELGDFGDQEIDYGQFGLGLEAWGGDAQVYAFNTVKCKATGTSGPYIWETGFASADLKYNLFIGCDAPGDVVEQGSKNLLNAYVDNGIDLAAETPNIDDTAEAPFYSNFSIWSAICEHEPATCPVWTFANTVPPLGGAVDDAYPNPTFSPGRGTSQTPKRKWAE